MYSRPFIQTILTIFVLTLLYISPLSAQNEVLIRGKVTDSISGKPLTFTSVMAQNQKRGTVTDNLGLFTLELPKLNQQDTLVVSYLGYKSIKRLFDKDSSFFHIKLSPNSITLNDVVVSPMNPTYYIDKALRNAPENYSYNPYYIIAYFENNFYEDQQLLEGTETVFKTYYKGNKDKPESEPEQEHQLLLYRDKETNHKLKFMRKELEKIIAKEQTNDSDIKSEEAEDFKIRLTPMYVPLHDISLPFLDKNYYKKFNYTLRESCSNRNLIIIDFKTKRRFSYKLTKFSGRGTIYIDCDNYAIIKLDIDMNMELSFIAKSLLFIAFKKLKVKNTNLQGSIEYKPIDGLWYPSTLTLSGSSDAVKIRWFSKNAKATFEFASTTLVNQIISERVVPIPDDKQFSFRKINLQNDMNISWDDINEVEHVLHKNTSENLTTPIDTEDTKDLKH